MWSLVVNCIGSNGLELGLEAGGIFFIGTKTQKNYNKNYKKKLGDLKIKSTKTPNMRELRKRSHSEQ